MLAGGVFLSVGPLTVPKNSASKRMTRLVAVSFGHPYFAVSFSSRIGVFNASNRLAH
jgi:hypothetical protein